MGQHSKLYKTAHWQAIRAAQLAEQPLCAFHLEAGEVVAGSIVDHVEPHRGDPDKFFNGKVQTLCKQCHDSLKQRQETTGFHNKFDEDGFPIDPSHPFNMTGEYMPETGGRVGFGAKVAGDRRGAFARIAEKLEEKG